MLGSVKLVDMKGDIGDLNLVRTKLLLLGEEAGLNLLVELELPASLVHFFQPF